MLAIRGAASGWLLAAALAAGAGGRAAGPAVAPVAPKLGGAPPAGGIHRARAPLLGSQDDGPQQQALSRTRHELGRRLRAFERAFAGADAGARARALPALKASVAAYFRMDAGTAASALAAARRAIEGGDAAAAWADALVLWPGTRCLEPTESSLSLRLCVLYEIEDVERPEGELRLRALLVSADGKTLGELDRGLQDLPGEFRLPLGELAQGDCELKASISLEGRELSQIVQTISVVRDARKRLDTALAAATEGSRAPALEASTLRGLQRLLLPLTRGESSETDLPMARLVAEAEDIAACVARGERWLDATRAGDHWLHVPVENGAVPVRIRIPAGLNGDGLRALVVGLHGAGGSENLFFDGYGDGLAPRLAAERGWIFVSPRAGFLSAPDVPGLVDALAERLPIDRSRVALIGHSMGAAHAAQQLSRSPERFAAAVLLSGGGSVRASAALKTVPIWLGAGAEDFGLGGTRSLAKALREAGVERVELSVLADIEHLAVVQAALPDVFRFLDGVLGRR